jgi:hypothetical protein
VCLKIKGERSAYPHISALKNARGDPREASQKMESDLSGSLF